jgi:thiamine pyrophosphate-dependent acetolactate synthase large subunit-like protein
MSVERLASERLDREWFVKQLVSPPGDFLIVTGLGNTVSNLVAAGDRHLNFYVMGAMGAAAGVGLGLAIAQPERSVIVVTGDGEFMMNVGILATIGVQQPKNLSIVILDNEQFGETGQQTSHTAFGIDVPAIATACRFAGAVTVRDEEEVPPAVRRTREMNGPFLAVVKIRPGRSKPGGATKSGDEQKIRFRRAVLGGR